MDTIEPEYFGRVERLKARRAGTFFLPVEQPGHKRRLRDPVRLRAERGDSNHCDR